MDKTAIKNFAIDSRNKLREEIKYQLNLIGITKNEIKEPSHKQDKFETYNFGGIEPTKLELDEITQRNNLISDLNDKGYDNIIEEIAYTWFNRVIAIRFMEVNNYLPTRVRVLSSAKKGKKEPDMITEAPNIDLNLTEEEKDKIYELKDENKLDDLFKFLFIKQCNELNKILPELFEKTKDYSELIFSISFTKPEGIIRQLIDNIAEEDFKDQVEIIGWLYQYYNSELKDETFKNLKKRVKISKERIPAATQLFTPDWIVKYMVENSLGKLWIEGHPDTGLKENWKYYLESAPQSEEVEKQLETLKIQYKNTPLEEIKVIDPCMGSGHILVYVFDVLMQIYLSQGYDKRDATISILENNIYGLDIDDRAYQLAYFAVMMKARQYHRKIFQKDVKLNLNSIKESNGIKSDIIDHISKDDEDLKRDLNYLKETFIDAKNYGSLLNVKALNYKEIIEKIENKKDKQELLFDKNKLLSIINQSNILSKQYEVVITNPPYMGGSGMNKQLSDYLKKNYPNTKRDLFATFIEQCANLTLKNGFFAMITQQSFMFLSSYEKLRKKYLRNTIINMAHLGPRAFEEIGGEVVQATSFIMNKSTINNYLSKFCRLINENSQKLKEKTFLTHEKEFITSTENFSSIPGTPIAYWVEPKLINAFRVGKKLSDIADVKQGLATADNNRFLRLWHEVDINKIGFGMKDFRDAKNSHKKWFPYNKGGSFRKWYGNQEYIINYENDGYELKNFGPSVLRNTSFYFKENIGWTKISSSDTSFRYFPKGFVLGNASGNIFPKNENINFLLGLLNSKISSKVLNILSPTLNYTEGNMSLIPILNNNLYYEDFILKNIELSKNDWNFNETSWNFTKNPLLTYKSNNLENSYLKYENIKKEMFNELKSNEEKLNKIFLDMYDLNEKISPVVEDKYVSIALTNSKDEIKSFLSYFIGCLFGRYCLDEEGLIFAGGKLDISKYSSFIPDDDNIIPILDTEYFEDDIINKLVEFLKITFGENTLEENIKFIANALDGGGETYRDTIRNYFLKDFFKDHVKNYKKRPIYWLFDSGKENGFKALIYIHRYKLDTVSCVRTDYLHKTQKSIEIAISHNEKIIENSTNQREKNKLTKKVNKLKKQLAETIKYDEALSHIANKQIAIDLDDGVKNNYELFQNIEINNKKVNLLKDIN
ncbi:MAG: BREX-1 system adenine-specific DNA-methyltransferase PglX [Methanobrevibacter sp.]|jgi:type II restriction/modification system DNA methylase subunit YeeA|nr:BREX-1 system adenine-specific DNA-methyltransferase PglX [Candidatus Methanoflexus mossambicus]